ncbi:MAG: polysaccharide biosynthesis C-terminal domain-containing protein [Desulfobacteraceae bacterium]|jgi:O-antigen/teichoic acid export membrane protein
MKDPLSKAENIPAQTAGLKKSFSSLGKFSLSSLAVTAILFLLRMIKNVVFTRLLGPSGRGVYGLLTTIPGLIISFGNLGFGLGSIYLLSKKKYELYKVLGNAFLYLLVQGAILTMVGAAPLSFNGILKADYHTVEKFSLLVLVAIPFLLAQRTGGTLLMGIKDIHFYNILQVLFSALPMLLMVAIWLIIKDALFSALVAWTGTIIIVAVISFVRLYRKADKNFGVSIPYIKEAFSFGLRGNISMFANEVVRRVDILFIAYFLGAEQVGYYAVSVSVAEIFLALPDAISLPFLPIRMGMDQSEASSFSPFVIKYVFLIMVFVCGITAFIGKPAIFILYGREFFPALVPMLCLLPGILALSLYQFLKADIYSINRPGFISIVSLITMTCNLVLNYLMIPQYGINGAAISSSISYAISTLIILVFFLRKTGLAWDEVLLVKKKDVQFVVDNVIPQIKNRM